MMVRVSELTVKFKDLTAVDDVSFEIRRGETLGLVGESGSGKTTIARVIASLQKPTSGSVTVNGRVGMVFQDPLGSLNPRQTVRDAIEEVLRVSPDMGLSVDGLLSAVDVDVALADRYPHEFSGGQRQRISIARELAFSPELLICDEAVSALDLSVRATVLDLISALKERFDLTVLFITHDLGVVSHVADRVIVLERGRIAEEGPCGEVLAAPRSEYTRKLVSSVLRLPPEGSAR